VFPAHAFVHQHLEVSPLNQAGVLKLGNHDVFDLRTCLLEDKRGVGIID
jgi:hypothetical protein